MIACRASGNVIRGRLLFALGVGAWLAGAAPSSAQVVRVYRSNGATWLGDVIFAQADYLRAQGDFLVSSAVARDINAGAASKEMDNAVKWVNTFFERRRLNREWRARENPGFLERQEKRREQYRRKLEKNLDADLTGDLNWMLAELAAETSYGTFLTRAERESLDNAGLSDDEKAHILVNEGKLAGGKSRTFRVDTAEELSTECWAEALCDERFDSARREFERARDAARREMSRDNKARLMKSVDQLSDTFNDVYPREVVKQMSPNDFLVYLAARRYVQSLALSTCRLIQVQRPLSADESFCFNGQTVCELLHHMMGKGLEFAKPQPGGEGTYRKLRDTVRRFYLRLVLNG